MSVELFEFLRENSFDVLRDDSDARWSHVHILKITLNIAIIRFEIKLLLVNTR